MVLPLRLFEPRYLQLYADIIDTSREFGVVLIERGTESRDDATTFDIGCVASIVGSGVNDDGSIGLITVGRQRIRVHEWLDPGPYPRAMVDDLSTEVPELADDPGLAMYQIAQLSGLQALDLQEVLEAPSTDSRALLVKDKVEETMELIRLQLEVGEG
jgi:Lon protease-like protein